jgi:Kdo2-lipid IVA lauroyltransferase/acyltransferase
VKKIRYAIETALVRFGAWLAPKLSRSIIHPLSQVLGWIAYQADYRGRPTAHENLRCAFAREGITKEQVHRIALASYQTFARTFIDLFWTKSMTKENYTQFIHLRMEDPDMEALARQKGGIWVTPHYGNFELMGLLWGFMDICFVIIAQDFKNQTLTEIFKLLREGSGHKVIPQQGAMLRLVKELKRGGHAALLADLNIKPSSAAAVVECFGLKTCVPTIHTNMAMRLGLPIMPALCLQTPDGRYRVTMAKPMIPTDFATPSAMAQAVWDGFERAIRENPEAWLWMYKHWRYLPGDDTDSRYPEYANANSAFSRMVQAC